MNTTKTKDSEEYLCRWQWARFVASRKGISGPSKVAAFALAAHINDKKGIAWPSHATLALHCGVSERQAQDNLAPLVKSKLLEIFDRGGGRGRSCRYRPLFVKEAVAFDGMMKSLKDIAPEKRNEVISSFEDNLKLGSPLPSNIRGNPELRGQNSELQGVKLGTLRSETRNSTAEDLSIYPYKTPIELNAEDSSVRIDFEGIDYSSTPDDPAWPGGFVAKASDQRARINVARESLRQLGYDLSARPRIGGVHADAFVMAQFSPQALVEILTLCTQGTLRRADLARALAALGIPKATQSLDDRASGAL